MTDTVLSIGGPVGSSSATELRNLNSLSFTHASSSMGSWSATIPFEASFADKMFEDIYVDHGGEVLFQGQLEKFDANCEAGTTSISGRGVLVDLDRTTEVVTYSNTTVYDALRSAWDGTGFDANILPPNRGLYDSTYATERDHKSLWSWDGDSNGGISTTGVEVDRNRLVFNSGNIILDDTNSNGYQEPAIYPNTSIDRFGLVIETAQPVSQLDAGMKRLDDVNADYATLEEVWETVSYNTPQRFHYFDIQFGTAGTRFRPVLENGADPIEIPRSEVFSPDPAGFSTIDSVEIEGTKFEVLQELHDIGAYDFTVRDYEDLNVESFPTGTVAAEPDWRVTSSSRSLDYSDYANVATVHGKTLDDGTTNTSTAKNQDEIDEMNSRGVGDAGEIQTFEKNPDLKTQAEVDSRAARLLDESVDERDESGALEIAPQQVAPGYSYPVSNWGDAFRYGSHIGINSLYFDGSDYITFDYSYPTSGVEGTAWTWEFLIHPEGLTELADSSYYTLFSYDDGINSAHIRIYGDGSVQFGEEGGSAYLTRTGPGVVLEEQSQRLSIVWGRGTSRREVLVNGQLESSFSDYSEPVASTDEINDWWLGSDQSGETQYQGGLDDVRLWVDASARSRQWIFDYKDEDLVETEVDLTALPVYFRFNDPADTSTILNDGNSRDHTSTNYGASYQDEFGQLEEIQYSLGTGDTISLDFDVSGRIDTELLRTQRESRSNRRSL